MKKQINPTINAHLIRGAFYLLLLLAVCVIPFALAQRNSGKLSNSLTRQENPGQLHRLPPVLARMIEPASQNQHLLPYDASWVPTGSLVTAREYQTATLLPNGNVLVAAGDDNSGGLSSAELYDPATGTWSSTGSLVTGRFHDTATLLPNGQVLVAGGENSTGYLSSAELYDPATGSWSSTGSMGDARWDHTATLLPNGQVLVAGGYGNSGFLSSAELYDPASGTWTATGSLATARYDHTATLLPNGNVLVAGGFNNTDRFLSSAELYDPATGSWSSTASMGTARAYHTATLLPNGQVLVAGGTDISGYLSSAELYDSATGTPTPTPTPTPTQGDLLVSINDNGRNGRGSINQYRQNGQFRRFAAGLSEPRGAAFDRSGNLFVANTTFDGISTFQASIVKITPDRVQSTFATLSGNLIGEGLAFDRAGNLYVIALDANDPNSASTIYKFTPDGVQSTFGTMPFLSLGLAFDSAGNLFAACTGSPNVPNSAAIYRFTPNGTRAVFVGQSAFGNFNGPSGLAFDGSGNLFVSTQTANPMGTDTILEFTRNRVESTFATGLDWPVGLAFDRSGNLFVANRGAFAPPGAIYKFAPDGSRTTFASAVNDPRFLVFH
jgi:sugar lactone lactonase YvrE